MSLWRRPSGIYESHVMVDGVRFRKSTGTSNKRLAQAIDRKHEEELLASRFQVEQHEYKPSMKFAELATRFLAENSKRWHQERLKIFLPYFAGHEIGQITKGLAKQYRTHRHSQKKLTETTINRDVECLRHILYWAVDQGILPANPLARLQLEKPRRKKRPVMSVEDEMKIIEHSAEHLQRIIICASDTGMRRGEILAQLWQDIDFARRVISVTHSKTADGEHREIPLTCRLFELLLKDRQKQGLVFTFNDNPINRIKTAWKGALKRSKVQHYRFKDLRSTFNSRLLEAGIIKDVRKELMGHSRNEDTNDLYSHIELPLLREAIRKLEEWREAEIQKLSKEEDVAELEEKAENTHAGSAA
ncbi:MAG TPA: integrase [Candidatus Angelobacter sp.]|jgi:integrase|nr:integrase [Candidatus Angelobacter sp.]